MMVLMLEQVVVLLLMVEMVMRWNSCRAGTIGWAPVASGDDCIGTDG